MGPRLRFTNQSDGRVQMLVRILRDGQCTRHFACNTGELRVAEFDDGEIAEFTFQPYPLPPGHRVRDMPDYMKTLPERVQFDMSRTELNGAVIMEGAEELYRVEKKLDGDRIVETRRHLGWEMPYNGLATAQFRLPASVVPDDPPPEPPAHRGGMAAYA